METQRTFIPAHFFWTLNPWVSIVNMEEKRISIFFHLSLENEFYSRPVIINWRWILRVCMNFYFHFNQFGKHKLWKILTWMVISVVSIIFQNLKNRLAVLTKQLCSKFTNFQSHLTSKLLVCNLVLASTNLDLLNLHFAFWNFSRFENLQISVYISNLIISEHSQQF